MVVTVIVVPVIGGVGVGLDGLAVGELVGVDVTVRLCSTPLLVTEEREEDLAAHVEGGEHGGDTVEGLRCLDAGVDADASAQGGHDALMCRCAVDVGSRAFRLGLLDLLFELADPSLQSR